MAVTGTITSTFQANDTRSVGINTNAVIGVNNSPTASYANGSAASQAQVLYQNVFTLSGTTSTFNFNSGAFFDSYGTAVVLTGVVAFQIVNLSTSNILVVGAAGTNPWTGVLTTTGTNTMQAGDCWQQFTTKAGGWAVSGTNCQFLFTGTSGQTFSFTFLGVGT